MIGPAEEQVEVPQEANVGATVITDGALCGAICDPSSAHAFPQPTPTFPPCARDAHGAIGKVRTIAAKVRRTMNVASGRHGAERQGRGVCAVGRRADEGTSVVYLAIAEKKPGFVSDSIAQLKRRLMALSVDTVVDRHLTRLDT